MSPTLAEPTPAAPDPNPWSSALPLLGAYLVGSWTFLQAVDWVLERTGLSPHWATMLFVVLVGVVPGVVIYVHARNRGAGADLLTWERRAILGNGALLLVALLGVARANDLGATTTTVEYVDPEGEDQTIVVAKDEYTRTVPIFPALAEGGTPDTALAWLSDGFPALVEFRLRQNPFVVPWALDFGPNREVGRAIPYRIRQAATFGAGRYVDGGYAYDTIAAAYTLTPRVREARTGEVLHERSFRGPDVFAVADSAGLFVLEHVGLTPHQVKQTPRTPLREAWTRDTAALVAYLRTASALPYTGEVARGMEAALRLDSTFALPAYVLAANLVTYGTDDDYARALTRQAARHRRRLPPIDQLNVLAWDRITHEDYDRARQLLRLKLQVATQPADVYDLLVTVALRSGSLDGYADAYVELADETGSADERGYAVIALLTAGRLAEARSRARALYTDHPEVPIAAQARAEVAIHDGDFDTARRVLDEIILVEPELAPSFDRLRETVEYMAADPEPRAVPAKWLGRYGYGGGSALEIEYREVNGHLVTLVSRQVACLMYPAGEDRYQGVFPNYFYVNEAGEEVDGRLLEVFFTEGPRPSEVERFTVRRPDPAAERANALLAEGETESAREAFAALRSVYPGRRTGLEALDHFDYLDASSSAARAAQALAYAGSYRDSAYTITPEAGNLRELRHADGRELDFLPVSGTDYICQTDPTLRIRFDSTGGGATADLYADRDGRYLVQEGSHMMRDK